MTAGSIALPGATAAPERKPVNKWLVTVSITFGTLMGAIDAIYQHFWPCHPANFPAGHAEGFTQTAYSQSALGHAGQGCHWDVLGAII